jgi:pimeloyl-ACP methyl ester carboxylesterase
MARFVLVHGAWHGGWCWERIVPLLGAAGHEVLAPDLPGLGADRTPFAADVLAQWADFVAGLVRGAAEPAVLVGHSRGGLVISEAAERALTKSASWFIWRHFSCPSARLAGRR